MIGISDLPCSQSGFGMPIRSQIVGVDVDVRDQRVGCLAAREPARPAHDQHHAEPAVGHRRLGAGEGDAVVGGADDQRVGRMAVALEGIQHRAHAAVERPGAGDEGGHVPPGLGRVREVGRRLEVELVAGQRLEELAVRLEEPDRQEEGLAGRFAEQVDRHRRDVVDAVRVDLDDAVVADLVRALRDVLLADQRRAVAGVPEAVHDVVAVVVERPAAVGEPEHAVGVRVLAGQQAGAAGRARRRGAERLPEEHALLRQPLDPGCRDRRSRRAGRTARCRASGGRRCSAVSRRRL